MYLLILFHLLQYVGTSIPVLKGSSKINSESFLHQKLFAENSHKKMFPFPICEGALTVKLGLSLVQVVDVEEINEAVVISAWIRQEWSDPSMKWKPWLYENISTINIQPTKVWVPDIYTYSNIEEDKSYNGFLDTVKTKINLHSNGKLTWNAPVILRLGCTINVKDYPFDTQSCEIKFGSFTYDRNTLDLFPEDPTADLTKYSENIQWRLVTMNSDHVIEDAVDSTKRANVVYRLIVQRKPLFLLVNLMFPNIVLSFISVAVYFVPVTAGERVSYVVSLLLAMALFLTSAFNLLPDSSEAIPFFSYFLGMSLITMFLLTISLCYTLSIYYANAMVMDLPQWMRHYVLESLTPYLGVNTKINKQKWRESSDKLKQKLLLVSGKCSVRLPYNHPGSLWSTYEQSYYEQFYDPTNEEVVNMFRNGNTISDISKRLSTILSFIEKSDDLMARQTEWQNVARTLDALFYYIFSFLFATIFMSCVFRVFQIYCS